MKPHENINKIYYRFNDIIKDLLKKIPWVRKIEKS